MITTNYQNSNVKQFNVQSFYFGCNIAAANGGVRPPVSCDSKYPSSTASHALPDKPSYHEHDSLLTRASHLHGLHWQ